MMSPNSIILLDIEGTITSKRFVTDTLFPYVRQHLSEYLTSYWNQEELKRDITALKEQAETDKKTGFADFVPIPSEGTSDEVREAVIRNVLRQMDLDRKTTGLKSLQGHMWKYGYDSGKIVGHVYSDAFEAIKKWAAEKKKIMIYSSGSIEAQKLLFRFSEHGDMTPYFCAHFDTTIGSKKEKTSYERIARECQARTADFTFYTDSVEEAHAATMAGMNVILVQRPEDEPGDASVIPDVKIIQNFKDALFS
nr:PREDICTED: enolase-phosphatase E1 [Bemisia tabaci]